MSKNIIIPELMKNLKKDRRGFPIPYVVLEDKKGVAHFKINDDIKQMKCIKEDLCGICGTTIKKNEHWFIGGQLSAFHPKGAFNDTSMHKECGEYALQVCPYLAYTQYKAKDDIDTNKIELERNITYFNPTQDQERLDFFCYVRAKDYVVINRGIQRYIHPQKPYLEIRFWLDGEEITLEQANNILSLKKKESFLPVNK